MYTQWRITDAWDLAMNTDEEELKMRDYIYASELGKSYLDVWAKMNGIPITNKPSPSARRKMEAGKIIEMVLLMILKRSGLLKVYQEKLNGQLPGLLPVHGRLDFGAGGQADYLSAKEFVDFFRDMSEQFGLPKSYQKVADNIMQLIRDTEQTGSQLQEYIFEAKSVAKFVFDLIEKQDSPREPNVLQNYHYLKYKKMDIGKIAYVNRDDMRIAEFYVYNNSENHEKYVQWLTPITDFYTQKIQPPKEPEIVYEADSMKFNKNTLGVEWSSYLTHYYGYKDTTQFRAKMADLVMNMNYVFERCYTGKKMTPANLESIVTFKKSMPNWDDLVDRAKLKYIILQEKRDAKANNENSNG